MSIGQYLRDTQAELHHVAWPTRLQTVVYTILVAVLSVTVALYLGLFDYLFTTGLARFLEVLPSAAPILDAQDLGSTTPAILDTTPAPVTPTMPTPAPVAPTPSLEDALKIQ